MTTDPLELQGKPPDLRGKTCQGLACLEYWHEGALLDPANVVFIRADGVWHKLSFDSGIISWAADVEPQASFEAPEIAANYRHVDLGTKHGFVGRRITAIEQLPIAGGAQVAISFQGGASITFRNARDATSYVAA